MIPMELQPVISFYANKKAFKALGDMYPFYFTIHGLSQESFFQFLPMLTFVEGTIYQADEENEVGYEEAYRNHWQFLTAFLKEQQLFDEKVADELGCAQKYYALERAMCSGQSFTDEDVVTAGEMKSYDFRVLHRLIYKLMQRPYEEDLLEIFKRVELLIELEGDIIDYAKDIAHNSFNAYRMFVRLYGKGSKARLEEHFHTLTTKAREGIDSASPEIRSQFLEMERGYRMITPVPEVPEPVIEK